MNDQIPADKVREIIDAHRDGARRRAGVILAALEALLPVPPRPTLADMTLVERAECRWMQCDVRNAVVTHGVLANSHGGNTHVLDAEGQVWYLPPTDVTPRPDLPRLEWPDDKKPDPAVQALPEGWRLADHREYGRVIVTNPTPNRDGRVYFVIPAADYMGYDWLFCPADELTYIDQEADQ